MFTGIIETMAQIATIERSQTNLIYTLATPLAAELKIDQSVAHNGVCLTVTIQHNTQYTVTAIDETIQKTNLATWQVGDWVNLERSMALNGRMDGHLVQGHVDQVGTCASIEDQAGSWLLTFDYEASKGNITVEKGSICVNGISLTVVNSEKGRFSVAIIPYTWEHTNLRYLTKGSMVNLEFDIIGKYVQRYLSQI